MQVITLSYKNNCVIINLSFLFLVAINYKIEIEKDVCVIKKTESVIKSRLPI